MSTNSLGIKAVIGFCGACIAFYIGAGFATMQEVMQYEASYGSRFIVVIAVAALIYIVSGLGIGLLPRVVAQEELRSGQLVELQWNGPGIGVKSQIVHHKNKWLSPALSALIDMARGLAAQVSACPAISPISRPDICTIPN